MSITVKDGKYAQNVYVVGEVSESMKAVDVQSVFSKTIQTHSAKPSNFSPSAWIPVDGFSKYGFNVAVTEGDHKFTVRIYWSKDGVTNHGREQFVVDPASSFFSVAGETKLPFMKIDLVNNDVTARTMTGNLYLKTL